MAEEHPAVTNFRNYIRIRTDHPNPDYAPCTEYLRGQAKELEAEFIVKEFAKGKPVVLVTLLGKDPSLPSVLLNSHTDVVPVFPERWLHDPFLAHKDEEGNIYGRGTQDMKSVGVQYLEALKRLRKDGHTFLRTIHLSFVPDEEVVEATGMVKLVESQLFRDLNVGFGLDEGCPNSTETFSVFYGERHFYWILIRCPGTSGHASLLQSGTPGEKLQKVIDAFMKFREEEKRRLEENNTLRLGDVTTVNLVLLEGGVHCNVMPAELCVGFDIRLSLTTDVETFEAMIHQWCKDAGDDVTYEFVVKYASANMTCVEDGKSPWWDAFSSACKREGMEIEKAIFPAGTDSCYLRALGIPVLGFSPINKSPMLLHEDNEYLNEDIFLRGIDIYASIIPSIANVEKF